MPAGRYKHVASRFQQWRILPPDCLSWLEHRDGEDFDAESAQPSTTTVAASATGRMGGDLPENVTEERLHQSRLYDLARERHKMIQESDYVRNQFIDHQVRKARSKSLGRLLEGLDIERYRNKSASGVEKLHQRSAHARLMILGSKLLGLSIDEISKFSEEELRQKLNMPASGGASVTVGTAPAEAEVVETSPSPTLQLSQPSRPATSRMPLLHPSWPETTPLSAGMRRSSVRPMSTAAAVMFPSVSITGGGAERGYNRRPGAGSTTAAAASAQSPDRRPRTASARRRVQSDPRCVQLINTLTPRYKPTAKAPDVGAIIRANPSLSGPPDQQQQLQRQKASKGRRTRREVLDMLDSLARTRYYEAKNLATLS